MQKLIGDKHGGKREVVFFPRREIEASPPPPLVRVLSDEPSKCEGALPSSSNPASTRQQRYQHSQSEDGGLPRSLWGSLGRAGESEDKRSSPGDHASRPLGSYFGRRQTQGSVESETSVKGRFGRAPGRTDTKISEISRIPTLSDRPAGDSAPAPSNFVSSRHYSHAEGVMRGSATSSTLKLRKQRLENNDLSLSRPEEEFFEQYIQGDIAPDENDDTLLEIIRSDHQKPPQPDSNFLFSDMELDEIEQRFCSQNMPSLLDSSPPERQSPKKVLSDFSISTPVSDEPSPPHADRFNAEQDPASTDRLLGQTELLPRLTRQNLLTLNREIPRAKEQKVKHFGKLQIKLQLLGDTSKSMDWKVQEEEDPLPTPDTNPRRQLDQAALQADFSDMAGDQSIDLKKFQQLERELRAQEHSVVEDSLIQVEEQDAIERVRIRQSAANNCCSRSLWRVEKTRQQCVKCSAKLVSHNAFEVGVLLVILLDCSLYFFESPDSIDWTNPIFVADFVILMIYTAEMLLKVSGQGFICNKHAYLREGWNLLDFAILLSSYAALILLLQGTNIKITALRVLRILRPLRAVSGIEGLRILVTAIISALPLLRDTAFILLIFLVIFAIAGVHLWAGVLNQRCISDLTGSEYIPPLNPDQAVVEEYLCGGDQSCPAGYTCTSLPGVNPNYGVTSFDNIGSALLQTFQIMTLEGWSQIMVYLSQSFSPWVVIFFVTFVFLGSFFLLNLTLAVIKWQFSDAHIKKQEEARAKNQMRKKKMNKRRGFKVTPGHMGSEKLRKLINAQIVLKRGLKSRKEKMQAERMLQMEREWNHQSIRLYQQYLTSPRHDQHTYNRISGRGLTLSSDHQNGGGALSSRSRHSLQGRLTTEEERPYTLRDALTGRSKRSSVFSENTEPQRVQSEERLPQQEESKDTPKRKLSLSESKVNKIFRRKESEGLAIAPVLSRVASSPSTSSVGTPRRNHSSALRSVPGIPVGNEPQSEDALASPPTPEEAKDPSGLLGGAGIGFLHQNSKQLSEVGEEREEEKSEVTHGRISSIGITPIQSFSMHSPASRNSNLHRQAIASAAIRSRQAGFNPLNLDIAPLVLPSGKTKRGTAEQVSEEEETNHSILESSPIVPPPLTSPREQTDFDQDFHARSGTPAAGRIRRPDLVLDTSNSIIETPEDLEPRPRRMTVLISQEVAAHSPPRPRELSYTCPDVNTSSSSSSIAPPAPPPFSRPQQGQEEQQNVEKWAEPSRKALSLFNVRKLDGRSALASSRALEASTRRISDVYVSMANSRGTSQSQSPQRSTRKQEGGAENLKMPDQEQLSVVASSHQAPSSYQRYNSLNEKDNLHQSRTDRRLKRSSTLHLARTERLLESDEEKESDSVSEGGDEVYALGSFQSHSSAVQSESEDQEEQRRHLAYVVRNSRRSIGGAGSSRFRRSVTMQIGRANLIRKKKTKMEHIQAMKQSFYINTPPAPGLGNIRTVADENRAVKKDIIQRVIHKQSKQPRKQDDSFENLKITIKEHVLQQSCATEVLKQPFQGPQQDKKTKPKSRSLKPYEIRLKCSRVPHEQIQETLQPSWFLAEPDNSPIRRLGSQQTGSFYPRRQSIFNSLLSVKGATDSHRLGYRVALSATGNHRLVMSMKPPDQDIINLETIRNLVHNRYDDSVLTPRIKSTLHARLFGDAAVTELHKRQQEELDKLDIRSPREPSSSSARPQPEESPFDRNLSPITEEIVSPQSPSSPVKKDSAVGVIQGFEQVLFLGSGLKEEPRMFNSSDGLPMKQFPSSSERSSKLMKCHSVSPQRSPATLAVPPWESGRTEGGSSMNSSFLTKSIYGKNQKQKGERKVFRVLEHMQEKENEKRRGKKKSRSPKMTTSSLARKSTPTPREIKKERKPSPTRRLSAILDPKQLKNKQDEIRDQAERAIERNLEQHTELTRKTRGSNLVPEVVQTQRGDSTLRRQHTVLMSPKSLRESANVWVPPLQMYYRSDYRTQEELEQQAHVKESRRQEEFAQGELEWKQICKQDFETELGALPLQPKREYEWSGDQVLHDFASLAHNLPLLPKPMPLSLYMFNKYQSLERAEQDASTVQLMPSTLVCPYIEDESTPTAAVESTRQLIRLNSLKLSSTSRFAPLISQQLEEMSLHLPSTYAATLHQQAAEGLHGLTEEDRVEFRDGFLSDAMARLSRIRVWPKGWTTPFLKFRYGVKQCVKSMLFENFMTLCVAINTIALASQHYGMSEHTSNILESINLVFTCIFIFEMAFKLFGLGLRRYLSDALNYLDGIVVVISVLELTMLPRGYETGAVTAFKTFRVFRTFRVLRVARLLRSLKQMQMIVAVITKSVGSFVYLALLLLLFLFIYTLLGMQLFANRFNFPEGRPRGHFDSFHAAFVTVFQLLTLENWQLVLFSGMRSFGGWSVFYFLSWIFIGNFVLLNLFLAILLDSFLDQDELSAKTAPKIQRQTSINSETPRMSPPPSDRSVLPAPLLSPRQRTNSKPNPPLVKHPTAGAGFKRMPTRRNSLLHLSPIEFNDRQASAASSYTSSQRPTKKSMTMPVNFLKKRVPKASAARKMWERVDSLDDFEDEPVKGGSMRRSNDQDRKILELKDIACEKAFFIFKRQNCLRRFCHRIYRHRYFEERVILALIVLSSVKLAADTYFLKLDSSHPVQRVSRYMDFFFTIVFTLEMLVKTITLGFAVDNDSYLREGWNFMDFIIVVASLLDMCLPWLNIESVRVLRLIRTIRPLRFISHNQDLKVVVHALLHSLGAIVNVAIVVFFVWLMFAIFGVSVLGGRFQYCSGGDVYSLSNRDACQSAGHIWTTYSSNFDNVINAMQTLFIVSSLEGWPDIMYHGIDSTEQDLGPQIDASPAIAFYFVVFIFIGSFFFVNLFVGVMFLNYKEAKKFDPLFKSTISDREARWIDIMRLISEAHPNLEPLQRPSKGCRLHLYQLVTSDFFDIMIIICIVLNMITLALHYDGASSSMLATLFYANLVFTGIFAMEMILKMTAMGRLYFKSKWNIFDFIVVISSLAEILIHYLSASQIPILRVAPQIIRIFRVLRVTRIIRLINKSKGLQALIFTILFAIRSLFNIFMLLMLIFFIYAVLGVFLFSEVREGAVISRYANFFNFGNSMITLLRISTGEDWNRIMDDCMRTGDKCVEGVNCGSKLAPVYFFSFVIVCSYVMLNLFILVIIQQFDDYYLPKENLLQNFKKQLQAFKAQWLRYAHRYQGRRMKQEDLFNFFRELPQPLGMAGTKPKDIIRSIIQMDIESDYSGLVYFHMLLFKAMRRVYGSKGMLTPSLLLLNYERQYYRRFRRMCHAQMQNLQRNEKRIQVLFADAKTNRANPMMTQLYLKTSFQKWRQMHHEFRLLERGPERNTTFRFKRRSTKDAAAILAKRQETANSSPKRRFTPK